MDAYAFITDGKFRDNVYMKNLDQLMEEKYRFKLKYDEYLKSNDHQIGGTVLHGVFKKGSAPFDSIQNPKFFRELSDIEEIEYT